MHHAVGVFRGDTGVSVKRVFFGAIVASLLCVVMSASPAAGYQLGAVPTSHVGAFGAHSLIHQPFTTYNGVDPRVYNVSLTFPSGDFMQIGYVDLANGWSECNHTGLAVFVTVLLAGGGYVGNLWNISSCNLTGTHWFTMVRTATSPNVIWRAKMDGVFVGPSFYTGSYNGYVWTDAVDAFSEYVKLPPTPGATMATTEYEKAMEILLSDGVWHVPGHADYFDTDVSCPPDYIHLIANNRFQTKQGTGGTECRSSHTTLW